MSVDIFTVNLQNTAMNGSPVIRMLFLLLICCGPRAFAQITGNITDETTGQPVAGASVYINNTEYGCLSDAAGYFNLETFPAPPFPLFISSIGYESTVLQVTERQVQNVKILLKPKAVDIDEVLILPPEKDGWALYGKEFTRNFIGYSGFAADCELLNKEDIEFRYDKKANKMMVSAPKPLKIQNKATGYLITYWLEHYEMEYGSRKLFFKGTVQFEALRSKRESVNRRWKANREAAFHGSLNHFMRSVYHNTVYEDSFELRVYKRIPAGEYGKTVPFKTDSLSARNDSLMIYALQSFLGYSETEVMQLAQPLARWLAAKEPYRFSVNGKTADSLTAARRRVDFNYNPEKPGEKWIQYFDYDFVPEDKISAFAKANLKFADSNGKAMPLPKYKPATFAYLWKQRMPLDSFVVRTGGDVLLKFKDYIQVTYLPEKEEREYLGGFLSPSRSPGTQQSIISVPNPEGIHITADGNFFESYDLMVEEYWGYEKTDKILPLNYQPGG